MARSPSYHQPNGRTAHRSDDVESALSSARPRWDRANLALRNDLNSELKRKLKDEVDHYGLEKYRKSVSQIKSEKNKKLKAFYETQNERLNDWLEVDMLVRSIADDVLDSMDPQDMDGDGVAEAGGMLKATHGDIAPLLPDDEREKRRQGERRAKWAINVRLEGIISSEHVGHRWGL